MEIFGAKLGTAARRNEQKSLAEEELEKLKKNISEYSFVAKILKKTVIKAITVIFGI